MRRPCLALFAAVAWALPSTRASAQVSTTRTAARGTAVQNSCVAIAEIGLMDTRYTSTFFDKAMRFFSRVFSDETMTFERAKGLALEASIPLEGILLGLGFGYDESGFQSVRRIADNTLETSLREVVSKEEYSRTSNDRVATLVENCLRENAVKAWVEFPRGGERTPNLVVSYKTDFDRGPVPVTFSYGTGVTCRRQAVGLPTTKISIKHGATVTIPCKRSAPLDLPVSITVNADAPITIGNAIWVPPVTKKSVPCEPVIPTDPVVVASAKESRTSYVVGPYCETVRVSASGAAYAVRNTGQRLAFAEIRILLGLPPRMMCSDRGESFEDHPGSLTAVCAPVTVQAGQRAVFGIEAIDGYADTRDVTMSLTVRREQTCLRTIVQDLVEGSGSNRATLCGGYWLHNLNSETTRNGIPAFCDLDLRKDGARNAITSKRLHHEERWSTDVAEGRFSMEVQVARQPQDGRCSLRIVVRDLTRAGEAP